MSARTECHVAVLYNELQRAIEHENSKIAAGRKSAVERWVETYIEHILYFDDEKLDYLRVIFESEKCWCGTRLNNSVLGRLLTEKKLGQIVNPLSRYDMACRYCVINKIPSLFNQLFISYKSGFSSNHCPVTDEHVRNSLLKRLKKEDPVLSFWIDRETGVLKKFRNVAECFDRALKLRWIEGIEYFFNQLSEIDKVKKLTKVTTKLSDVKATKQDAAVLDFCVFNFIDVDTLIMKLTKKYEGVYALFSALINSSFFDTVNDLLNSRCFTDNNNNQKIFTQREYELVLSLLSLSMLRNPELSAQARSLIIKVWNRGGLSAYRKEAIINSSNGRMPISGVLASLIVNWERNDRKCCERKDIMKMMFFARNLFPVRYKYVKEKMMKNLRSFGKECRVDYCKSAEELFEDLEKPPISMDQAIAIVERELCDFADMSSMTCESS